MPGRFYVADLNAWNTRSFTATFHMSLGHRVITVSGNLVRETPQSQEFV